MLRNNKNLQAGGGGGRRHPAPSNFQQVMSPENGVWNLGLVNVPNRGGVAGNGNFFAKYHHDASSYSPATRPHGHGGTPAIFFGTGEDDGMMDESTGLFGLGDFAPEAGYVSAGVVQGRGMSRGNGSGFGAGLHGDVSRSGNKDGVPLFGGDDLLFKTWKQEFLAFATVKKFRKVLKLVDLGLGPDSEPFVDADDDEAGASDATKKLNDSTVLDHEQQVEMNALAYAWLVRACSGSAKRLIGHAALVEDGNRAWMSLCAEYEGRDRLRLNNLKTEMLNTSCPEGGDVMEFLLVMEEMYHELTSGSDSKIMCEDELVSLILRGLPPSFEQFEAMLLMVDNLDLDTLRDKLRTFSNNRKYKQRAAGDDMSSWTMVGRPMMSRVPATHLQPVVPQSARPAAQVSQYGTFNGKCHHCQQVGHMKGQCPNRNRPKVITSTAGAVTPNRPAGNMECDFCGGAHHFNQCPKSHRNRKAASAAGSSRPGSAYLAAGPGDNDVDVGGVDATFAGSDVGFAGTVSGVHPFATEFLVDSGCSTHMVSDPRAFVPDSFKRSTEVRKIRGINKDAPMLDVLGSGNVIYDVDSGAWGKKLRILVKDVLLVPGCAQNVLSTTMLGDVGCATILTSSGLLRSPTHGDIHLKRRGNLFYLPGVLRIHEQDWTQAFIAVTSPLVLASSTLTHRRFGHVSDASLEKLASSTVGSEKFAARPADCLCDVCLKTKSKRLPFANSAVRATEKLQRVFVDVYGPLPAPGIDRGEKYIFGFTDDFSRLGVVFAVANKSADVMLECMKAFIAQVGKPRSFRSDNGGENTAAIVQKFCAEQGIAMEFSMDYSPEQVAGQERQWQTLAAMSRGMLLDSGLGEEFAGLAMRAAQYVKNRVPSRVIGFETPLGKFSGTKPDVSKLRVFGCAAYVHIDRQKRDNKFAPRAWLGIHVGYDRQSGGYLVFDPNSNKVVRSRNVRFNENLRGGDILNADFKAPDSGDFEWDSDDAENEPLAVPKIRAEPVSVPVPALDLEDADQVGENIVVDQPQLQSRAGRNLSKPKEFWKASALVADSGVELANSVPIPKNFNEAMVWDVRWAEAIQAEYDAMNLMQVWKVVPKSEVPAGHNLIGTRFVFDVKSNPDGTLERMKARLVAQGFSQVEGVDFNETYAPVLKMATLRCALALAAARRYSVVQLDVTTAFLYGSLKERLFAKIPPGYNEFVDADLNGNDYVLELKKSMYGLKQAGRSWNDTLHEYMTSLGFARGRKDKCVYIKSNGGNYLVCLVYVDDLIVIAERDSDSASFVAEFRTKFKIKDPKSLDLFLGINVDYDRAAGTLVMSQQNYVATMLKTFGLADANSQYVPAAMEKLVRDLEYEKSAGTSRDRAEEIRTYQSMVGSVLYASTCTRPDIAFAVGRCGSYAAYPGPQHLVAVKRVLKYLKGTASDGISYCADSDLNLVGFADADWAGDRDTSRSCGGYVFLLAGGAVTWSSKMQATVAKSSAEAEYMSLAAAVMEAKHLRQLLEELGCKQDGPTTIFEDNQACIFMAQNDMFSKRTKHIDVAYHFVQEAVNELGLVKIAKVDTNLNPADIFTKPLSADKLRGFKSDVMFCGES